MNQRFVFFNTILYIIAATDTHFEIHSISGVRSTFQLHPQLDFSDIQSQIESRFAIPKAEQHFLCEASPFSSREIRRGASYSLTLVRQKPQRFLVSIILYTEITRRYVTTVYSDE